MADILEAVDDMAADTLNCHYRCIHGITVHATQSHTYMHGECSVCCALYSCIVAREPLVCMLIQHICIIVTWDTTYSDSAAWKSFALRKCSTYQQQHGQNA